MLILIFLRLIFRELMYRMLYALKIQWIKFLIKKIDRAWANLIKTLFRLVNLFLIGFIHKHFQQIRIWLTHLTIFWFYKILENVLRFHYSELEALRLNKLTLTQSLRFNQHLFKFPFFFIHFQILSYSVINNFFCAHWLTHYLSSHHFI